MRDWHLFACHHSELMTYLHNEYIAPVNGDLLTFASQIQQRGWPGAVDEIDNDRVRSQLFDFERYVIAVATHWCGINDDVVTFGLKVTQRDVWQAQKC